MTTNTTFSPTITTDVLIIGFGKGGKTLAAKLSATGHKVVVAEASANMYGGHRQFLDHIIEPGG